MPLAAEIAGLRDRVLAAPGRPPVLGANEDPEAEADVRLRFHRHAGLRPKEGGKGAYILWTPGDYQVTEASERQQYDDLSENLP